MKVKVTNLLNYINILINGKTGKKEMTFWRENAFISIQIKYTSKWKNGHKRNDFLVRKCIY